MIYEEISKENIVEKKLMYEEHDMPSKIACMQTNAAIQCMRRIHVGAFK